MVRLDEIAIGRGTEVVIERDDCNEIPRGHEVLVVGSEPWESVQFANAHALGLSREGVRGAVLATAALRALAARACRGPTLASPR